MRGISCLDSIYNSIFFLTFLNVQHFWVSAFIKQCYQTDNLFVVTITSTLFQKGLKLYESRADKSWGLVDCFSFILMEENQITDALTSDVHFIQAGFQALL